MRFCQFFSSASKVDAASGNFFMTADGVEHVRSIGSNNAHAATDDFLNVDYGFNAAPPFSGIR